MSLLIKGMEMPNNCQECVCINDEYFYCQAVGRQPQDENVVSRRPDWCPLADVPTPHGRLIDKDKLLSQFREMSLDDLSLAEDFIEHGVDEVIDDAPTIIEAEE